MTEQFDAVIVGSGFGGSVMAYRLADAGLSVCVLERGKPYPPGSFARSPYDLRNNVWDPSQGLYGLFDFWSFRGRMSAVVSSGLGGGSLIYANVLLRKDEKWFVTETQKKGAYERWPVTRAQLEPHYDEVEKILAPQRYPIELEPYSLASRAQAFKEAGEKLHQRNPEVSWFLPPLAITFHNKGARPVPGELILADYENLHFRQRSTCRLCGECYVGCNYGSKNTLDYNFLSLARLRGAEIRVLCEVKSFRPNPDGTYQVDYVAHDTARSSDGPKTRKPVLGSIRASKLILSAGTLGTTYLMLRNRDAFPRLSPVLGTKFSGNGDYLGIALKARSGAEPRRLQSDFGPALTSTIRVDDRLDGGSGPGLYIQDAGYPAFVSWAAEVADTPGQLYRAVRYLIARLKAWYSRDPKTEVAADFRDLIGACEVSADSMGLLGMGRDRPAGRMSLLPPDSSGVRFMDLDFPIDESREYFDRVIETAREMAELIGADFKQDPVTEFLKRLITVHPLGGCSMGDNDALGVVDPFGEVFNYPGLFIADGSVMPGPVGPNPSLTIAALAHRFAGAVLGDRSSV